MKQLAAKTKFNYSYRRNNMNKIVFKDRVQAGEMLAEALTAYANQADVIVLGLPRGGGPVADQVARRLNAPLDLIVVRKLGVPGREELAMGAIASGGIQVINAHVVRASRITPAAIERVAAAELKELQRREIAFRGHSAAPKVKGKTVILVDDGIATGATIQAAIQALRQQEPRRIVIAVPTAASDSCEMLEPLVDELVALIRPSQFNSVGQWYENFQQTSDAEVRQLIHPSRQNG
jgi:putative phosphoribosyl transferase